MRIAVISAVYNEEILLPQFLDYYSRQVDEVFIVDNESTDGSVDIASSYGNVSVSRYTSGGVFSDVALSRAYDRKREECKNSFDYVLIVDCDEFIVPKSGRTVKEELQSQQEMTAKSPPLEYYRTHGYNMWARPSDPPYDPSLPLMVQRRWGIEDLKGYSKPCIIRPESTLLYENGRHRFRNGPALTPESAQSSPFLLLHYIGVDEWIYVKRGLDRTTRFAEENVVLGTSRHHYLKSKAAYRLVFHRHARNPMLRPVPIAESVVKRQIELKNRPSTVRGQCKR